MKGTNDSVHQFIYIGTQEEYRDTLAQMGLGAHVEADFASGHEGQQKRLLQMNQQQKEDHGKCGSASE